jgi:hypothetical protein
VLTLLHAALTVYSAHMREKSLEALLWFTQLPAPRDRPPQLTPHEMVQWMSTGVGCHDGVSLAQSLS